MKDIVRTMIFLVAMYIASLITNRKYKLSVYFIFGLIVLFANLCVSNCWAYSYIPTSEFHISMIENNLLEKRLEESQITEIQRKRDFHYDNALRCYKNAKDRCWYLPNLDERASARYCINAAAGMATPGSLQSKLIVTLINLLVQYGLDCNDEWH